MTFQFNEHLVHKLQVMMAYACGAKIERRNLATKVVTWYGTRFPSWDWGTYDYRVKVDDKAPTGPCEETIRLLRQEVQDLQKLLTSCLKRIEKQRVLIAAIRRELNDSADESKDHAEPVYLIVNDESPDESYWSNAEGWVSKEDASWFTPEDRLEMNLPTGGRWVLMLSDAAST